MLATNSVSRNALSHLAIIFFGLALSITLIFVGGEIVYRVLRLIKNNVSLLASAKDFATGPLILHEVRGWAANPQYSFSGKRQNASGDWYDANVTFYGNGFRSFGSPESKKIKLLVVGDSMTHAIEVGDGKAYYDILGKEFDWEIFAYGVGGYGTLQQHLVLEEYLQNLSVDLVLWQFSTNDFINNDFELESRSLMNANNMPRPYWVMGDIVVKEPRPLYSLPFFLFLKDSSIFINILQVRYQYLMYAIFGKKSIEHEIILMGDQHLGFRRSQQVTAEILERSIEILQNKPILAFLAGARGDDVFSDAFRRILNKSDIRYLGNVSDALDNKDPDRNRFYYIDRAHWNEVGHAMVASFIKEKINL